MKKIAISFLVLVLGIGCAWSISYKNDSYSVKIVVGKNAVHYVQEDIAMNFMTEGHGFYRDIPVRFDGSKTKAKIGELKCSEEYEGEYSDGIYSMKIGSSSKTVFGPNNYRITYTYDLGADYNQGYDEFYYDLLGSEWECETSHFGYEVYLPSSNLDLSDVKIWVTSGYYSSSHQEQYNVAKTDGYYVISGSVSNLRPSQAVTIRIQLPDNWYSGAREMWDVRPFFKIFGPILSLVLTALAFAVWMINGKDDTPIITARFESPMGFSPMVVGYLADSSVDDKDIISMLFYWADKGLLTINEPKKDKFSFTKLAEIDADAPKTERALFDSFFDGCRIGDTKTLSSLKNNNFAEAMMKAKLGVTMDFRKDRALYSRSSKALSVLVCLLSFIPFVLLSASGLLCEYEAEIFGASLVPCFFVSGLSILFFIVLFNKWYIRKSNVVPCILCSVPAVILAVVFLACGFNPVSVFVDVFCGLAISFLGVITQKRSRYGQEVLEGILGYKEFIEKAEIDQLKAMIDENPQFYYKTLSYAIVLGLEEKWAKKFASIAVPAPNWYMGYNTFNIMYCSQMSRRMRTVMAMNAMSNVRTSSTGARVGGGGFNMSGFAGGGFGGGGGHAW